ncbi:hypothetical protein [Lysinibacillus sp. CTST325]
MEEIDRRIKEMDRISQSEDNHIEPQDLRENDEKNSREMNRTVHSVHFYGYDMI